MSDPADSFVVILLCRFDRLRIKDDILGNTPYAGYECLIYNLNFIGILLNMRIREIPIIQILVVDDHALVREGYIRLINSDGRFKVIGSASSGKEAISLLEKINLDVMITDLSMPEISGLSVIVNSLALHPNLKIILCSMHDTMHIVNAAIAAGAKGFVSKSSDPNLIIEAITTVYKNKIYLSHDMLRLRNEGQISLEQLRLESLTTSEFETFKMLAEGNSVRQISNKLNLAEKTINNNQTQIRCKLQLETAAQLVHYAYRNRLIIFET